MASRLKTSRAASPPESALSRFFSVVAREEHHAHAGSDIATVPCPGKKSHNPLLSRVRRGLELLVVVLSEITRMGLVSPDHLSSVGLELTHDDS